MRNKQFNCTQQELHAVCSLGWENCSQNYEHFARFKPRYTPEFLEERKAELETIARMDDYTQRSANVQRARMDLMKLLDACLMGWRKLKTHIAEAWPPEEQANALKSAGQPHYKASTYMKWEACISLLNNAETFISKNSVALQLNNNMSSDFEQEFIGLSNAFKAGHMYYLDCINKAGLATAERMQASDKAFKSLKSMFTDAKLIFRKQPEKLKLFVFDSVLLVVSGPGTAGIKGTVSNGKVPLTQIEGVLLTLQETGDTLEANDDGTYRFSQLAVGTYSIKAEAPGYKELIIPNITVNTGSYTTVNILLEKESLQGN